MKISDRTKSLLRNGLGVLALNLIFQRDWGPVIFGVVAFIVVALIFPYLIAFMSDADEINR